MLHAYEITLDDGTSHLVRNVHRTLANQDFLILLDSKGRPLIHFRPHQLRSMTKVVAPRKPRKRTTYLSKEQKAELLSLKGTMTQQEAADRFGIAKITVWDYWRKSK